MGTMVSSQINKEEQQKAAQVLMQEVLTWMDKTDQI